MEPTFSSSSAGSDPWRVTDPANGLPPDDDAELGQPQDSTPSRPLTKATIAGAVIGFCIALVSAIVLFVQFVSWTSSWGVVVRRMLGFP